MVNLRLSIVKIRFCYRVGLLSPGLGAVSKNAVVWGDRGFESISLQRGVGCELDFLNHGRRRPFVCHDMAFGIWVGLSPKETRSRGWD